MMKKCLMLVLVLTMLVSATALSEPATSEIVPAEMTGNISFYYWDDNQTPAMKEIVQQFNQVYPKISVEMTAIPFGQYVMKLQTTLPTGTGPDVFWMNSYASLFASLGMLKDLAPFVERDQVDLSVFHEQILDLYAIDDALYGVPKDVDVVCMAYNKKMFDEAGVSYPTPEWTWEDMSEMAQALTTEEHFGLVYNINAIAEGYYSLVVQAGGQLMGDDRLTVSISTPETVEAFEFARDLMYEKKVMPAPDKLDEIPPLELFVNRMSAMLAVGSWNVRNLVDSLGDEVAFVELPKHKQQGTLLNGLAYAMANTTKNEDAAWEFIKFAATREAQKAQIDVVIPAYKEIAEQWAKQFDEKTGADAFIRSLPFGTTLKPFLVPNTLEVQDVLYSAIREINADPSIDIKTKLEETQAQMISMIGK